MLGLNPVTPYQPTVCRKRTKGMIEVTPKNIGKVIGDINRFLSKPTVKLNGFENKYRTVPAIFAPYDGGEMIYTTVEEKVSEDYYPHYIPVRSKCEKCKSEDSSIVGNYATERDHIQVFFNGEWHDTTRPISTESIFKMLYYKDPVRIMYPDGSSLRLNHSNYNKNWGFYEPPVLCIRSKFSGCDVLISYGDRYKIYGTKLIIMNKFNSVLTSTRWTRFNEFVNVDHINQSEVNNIKISKITSDIDSSYLDMLEYCKKEYNTLKDQGYDMSDLCDVINDKVKEILINHADENSITVPASFQDVEFNITFHPKDALDDNHTEWDYIEYSSDVLEASTKNEVELLEGIYYSTHERPSNVKDDNDEDDEWEEEIDNWGDDDEW